MNEKDEIGMIGSSKEQLKRENGSMTAGNARLPVPEMSFQTILELARAVQRIRTLAELKQKKISVDGRTVSARRCIVELSHTCCNPRRIIALMLHAADNPDWAWCNFWAAFCPEMTMKQMAALRKINISTVKYHLTRTELPSDAYEFIPENQ